MRESNESPAGFGSPTARVSGMSNLARIDAVAPVPPRTVRLVAALTVVSWFGMIVHDRISLPELSLLAPDVVLPTVVSVALRRVVGRARAARLPGPAARRPLWWPPGPSHVIPTR